MTTRKINLAPGDDLGVYIGGVLKATVDGTGMSLGAGKRLRQKGRFSTGAYVTSTASIPFDNTKPTITEGDQVMTLTVPGAKAGNSVEVNALLHLGASASTAVLFASLFAYGASASIAGGICQNINFAGISPLMLSAVITPVTDGDIVLAVRIGVNTATAYFNGANGAAVFDGVLSSYIDAKEYWA